jgi:hypothetical protein
MFTRAYGYKEGTFLYEQGRLRSCGLPQARIRRATPLSLADTIKWARATPSPLKPAPTRERESGKVFKRFGAKEEILRQARLAAIEGIRDLVIAGAHHVAGGIYDNETPSPVTLRSPIERLPDRFGRFAFKIPHRRRNSCLDRAGR